MKKFWRVLLVVSLIFWVLNIEYRAETLDVKVQTLEGAENPQSGVLMNFINSHFSSELTLENIEAKKRKAYEDSVSRCLKEAKGWANGGENWDQVEAWLSEYRIVAKKIDIEMSVIAKNHVDILLVSIRSFGNRGNSKSVAKAEQMLDKYSLLLFTNKN